MDCSDHSISDDQSAYLRLGRKVAEQRIPFNGSIELTRRCNFNCVHCYLGEEKNSSTNNNKELDAGQWQRIIDEIVDAGCLYLLFSGGDPLIRDDFPDIYGYARRKGLIVTVFTNGSMLSKKVLNTFKTFPPHHVEISIYGATSETCQKVTRFSDGFNKCLTNIRKLVDAGIHTKLKTVLLAGNIHEFDKIRELAVTLGLKFRFDGMISPCLDGNSAPIKHRILPKEVAKKNVSAAEKSKWLELCDQFKGVSLSDVLYGCGAGTNHFHIDPSGVLTPCLMVSDIRYDLKTGDFFEGWHQVIPKIKEKKMPVDFKCKTCKYQMLCSYCPALFKLESGSETKVSKYLCEIGHEMAAMLFENNNSGEFVNVRKSEKEKAAI